MNDLLKRTLTGGVYVASVLAAICFNPIISSIYFGIIGLVALSEFYNVAKNKYQISNSILAYLTAIALYTTVVLYSFNIDFKLPLLISVVLVIANFIAALYQKNEEPFTSIAFLICGLIYIILPISTTNLIIQYNSEFQPLLLLSVFILAWCNDTFAYLTGVKFGKHRLFERHSPKKSWEGFVGGFLFTIIAGIVISKFSNIFAMQHWIVISIIVSIIGTLGDLVESMFKRQMGVKDSGKILPGHGGILDRFDILFIVLPIVWVYLELIVK
jgi:phosphatidate cytidylyltransferase